MNMLIFYELFCNYLLYVLFVWILVSMLVFGLVLVGVWVLLLGWGIGLGIDNFVMYFGWIVLFMIIFLVVLFFGVMLLCMEVIWLVFLFVLFLLISLIGCLVLVGVGFE